MIKKLIAMLVVMISIFANNLEIKEIDGRFYNEGILFTGERLTRDFYPGAASFRDNDIVTLYEEGLVKGKVITSYDETMIGYSKKYVRNTIKSIRTWNFEDETIHAKYYVMGDLVEEGYYDFDYRKIGLWKEYIDNGNMTRKTFDYDAYNSYMNQKEEGDYTIDKEKWSEFEKILYNPQIRTKYFDDKGNELVLTTDFSYDGFNGLIESYKDDAIYSRLYFRDGFLYKSQYYYINGSLSDEISLELEKKLFSKKWKGYMRRYYSNGNIAEEYRVTVGRSYRSPFSAFKSNLNPANTINLSSGFYESFSTSGPFKHYYYNGQLMVEGENHSSSQDINKLKVYDIEGNRIFVEE